MSVLSRGEEGRVFRGGPLPQSLMGSFGVVLLAPHLDDGTGFRQEAEVMLVQALVPQSAVEALDETVLDRMARAREGERDANRWPLHVPSFQRSVRPRGGGARRSRNHGFGACVSALSSVFGA